MGLFSTLAYTPELILWSIICVLSASLHKIYELKSRELGQVQFIHIK